MFGESDRPGYMLYRNVAGQIVWFPISRESVLLRWEMGLPVEYVNTLKGR